MNLRHLGYLVALAQERTHICDVEVDPETGKVQVLRYTAVQDVGRAIHPSYVEGQIQCGAVQRIGWALHEEFIYDSNGRLDNPTFLDYRMPVAPDSRCSRPSSSRCPTRNTHKAFAASEKCLSCHRWRRLRMPFAAPQVCA